MSATNLQLVDIQGRVAAKVPFEGGQVELPGDYRWVWVLDARHAPYSEMSRDDLLKRAEGARKRFVLVAVESAA